jgi:8-oxo-dGTP pyrophosphatase MutT (NUDIX family)
MFKEAPDNFNKKFDVVGCFIENDGRFLLLHRHPHKASGDCWGLPAGKAEAGENINYAVLRELKEETGILLQESDIKFINSLYVRDGDFDFKWHTFSVTLDSKPNVILSPHEHSEFLWVSPSEALHMRLVQDLPELIEMFY